MGTFPVALRDEFYGSASLGVDCHSWGVGGIPEQMRLLLQAARAERGAKLAAEKDGSGLWSRHTGFDAESAFNLGTVGGARAAGLKDQVGSLKEGLRADIVVFAGDSPAMLAAAQEDPVAAIVMHSSPRDVETVVVDGVVRKEGGRLVDVSVVAAPVEEKSVLKPGTKLSWGDVVAGLLESRRVVKERMRGIDFEKGEEYLLQSMHLNTGALLEAQTK